MAQNHFCKNALQFLAGRSRAPEQKGSSKEALLVLAPLPATSGRPAHISCSGVSPGLTQCPAHPPAQFHPSFALSHLCQDKELAWLKES